ncbi:MAG: BamA/TamA family outer membrane protein [Gemmatimonadota bacterium]
MLGSCIVLAALAAQHAPASAIAQERVVRVAPGPQYAPSSTLHEWLLGSRYRDLWAAPIEVPILDLEEFAGGLTPVQRGGSAQTLALRFEAPDGREYNFRSIDKELTAALPPFARETFVDWVRQDQTSAQFPTAPIVATPLLDAAGILNPGPQLVVLPDDPRLGEFREDFAGMLGTIEVHPDEGPEDEPLFHGAARVAGTDRLIEHLLEDLDHRVDARAYLRARLMDVLIGDWDRHAGQWRWARYEREGLQWWVPVPEDRDYAFVVYDGLLLDIARRSGLVRLVRFRPSYPGLLAMLDNSLYLDRLLLAELPYEAWQAAAMGLQGVITDEVLRRAIEQMPPEHLESAGEFLFDTLRERRERLPEAARELYAILGHTVEVHGTVERDRLEARHYEDGRLELRLLTGEPSGEPRYRRVFLPDETAEVRVFLHGGDDSAVLTGAEGEIVVRVIGGEGADSLADRSGGPTAFYDSQGHNVFVRGADTSVTTDRWHGGTGSIEAALAPEREEPVEEEERPVAAVEALVPSLERDWGSSFTRFNPAIEWRSHAELVIGGGPVWTDHGFRYRPHARRVGVAAAYAPLHNRFELEARGDLRRENSLTHLEVVGLATQLEAKHYRGLGNDSPLLAPDETRVWLERIRLRATLHRPWSSSGGWSAGPVVEFTKPEVPLGSPAARFDPLGADPLGRVGAEAALHHDSRDPSIFPRTGLSARLSGTAFPAVWDASGPSGRADLLITAYRSLPLPNRPVMAVRAGGSSALGDYPFYDAASIGGSRSLRGYPFERFSGEHALFAGSELRVPLSEANILVRGDLGVSVFGDLGRVYVDGESPGGWHSGVGGSVWFAVPVGALTASYAHGEGHRFYLHLGMPF